MHVTSSLYYVLDANIVEVSSHNCMHNNDHLASPHDDSLFDTNAEITALIIKGPPV